MHDVRGTVAVFPLISMHTTHSHKMRPLRARVTAWPSVARCTCIVPVVSDSLHSIHAYPCKLKQWTGKESGGGGALRSTVSVVFTRKKT